MTDRYSEPDEDEEGLADLQTVPASLKLLYPMECFHHSDQLRRIWLNEYIGPTLEKSLERMGILGRIDIRRLVDHIVDPESSTTLKEAESLDWMRYMPEILELAKRLVHPANG